MPEPGKNKSWSTGAFGFLFVALVVLKLVGVVDWPWWVISAPVWGVLVLAFAFICFTFCCNITLHFLSPKKQYLRGMPFRKKKRSKKRKKAWK